MAHVYIYEKTAVHKKLNNIDKKMNFFPDKRLEVNYLFVRDMIMEKINVFTIGIVK